MTLRPLLRGLFSGGGGSGAAGIPGLDPDAVGWAERVIAAGGTYSSATLAATSNFCVSAKASGYWGKLNRVNLFAGNQLTACLVPLKVGAGSSTDTNTNFVAGDYTEATGLTGNGTTKSLDTGVAQNTFTAADRHLSVYERVRGSTTGKISIGAETALNTNRWNIGISSPATQTHYFAGAGGEGALQSGLVAGGVGGHFVGTGTDIEARIYKNGGSVVTAAIAAATPGTTTIKVMALNRAGAAAIWTDGIVAGYTMGTALTAGDITDFYTHMQAFQTALGRQV